MTIDLHKQQYSEQELIDNIYFVSLIDILKTQHLSPNFCVNYILNSDYQLTTEEEKIDIVTVLNYQQHLTLTQLILSTYSNNFNFTDYL